MEQTDWMNLRERSMVRLFRPSWRNAQTRICLQTRDTTTLTGITDVCQRGRAIASRIAILLAVYFPYRPSLSPSLPRQKRVETSRRLPPSPSAVPFPCKACHWEATTGCTDPSDRESSTIAHPQSVQEALTQEPLQPARPPNRKTPVSARRHSDERSQPR